jgi:hypothetical protein
VKKSVVSFWALDQKFLKQKIPLLELLIKCQIPSVLFWQLIESFINDLIK